MSHQVQAVDLTEEGSRWLHALPTEFEVFQWHAHTFTVPVSATALWRGRCIEQQGFIKGNILAMQFHLEVTEEVIIKLSQKYASDLAEPSECVQTYEQMTENLMTHVESLHQVADQLYDQWIKLAVMTKEK